MKLKLGGYFLGLMLHHPIFLKKIHVALESRTLIWVPLLQAKTLKQLSMATKLGQKSSWYKFKTVTFMEVKGQQRSNTVNNICPSYMIFGE